METIIQVLLIIGIAAFILTKFLPMKEIDDISTEKTKAKRKDANIQFLDVRTPSEYKASHQKPFRNIPLAELNSKVANLDKNKETIVICQSGMRSRKASKLLKKHGFKNVKSVRGGINSW